MTTKRTKAPKGRATAPRGVKNDVAVEKSISEDRLHELRALRIQAYKSQPQIHKLLTSPEFNRVLRMLEGRRRAPGATDSLEVFLMGTVASALAPPDVTERTTRTERRKIAARVVKATTDLWDALGPLVAGTERIPFEFQCTFDGFALEIAIEDQERMRGKRIESSIGDELLHAARYSVYHLMMDRMERLLETVDEAACWWADCETILKKPNDKNAARLLFIRRMTRSLYYEFHEPMRGAVLALASIYFDCSDLDEAAISKLAPRPCKPSNPVIVSREQYAAMKKLMAEHGLDLDAARDWAESR